MKDINNTEELFDDIFRESLENAGTSVPPGVWEGVSSSIGSSAAVAGVAVKTAFWMKAAIIAVAVSAGAFAAYNFIDKDVVASEQPIPSSSIAPTETPTVDQEEENNNTNQVQSNPVTGTGKVSNPIKGQTNQNPDDIKVDNDDHKISGPNQEYGIDANLVNPNIKNEVTNPKSKSDNVNPDAEPQDEIVKPFEKPEYTYIKDSSYIFIPNSVTPNGDGINDTYMIKLVGEEKVEIIVYSISNEILFRTTNKYMGWDCKLKNGEDAPEGTYLVKVIYNFKGKQSETELRKLVIIK